MTDQSAVSASGCMKALLILAFVGLATVVMACVVLGALSSLSSTDDARVAPAIRTDARCGTEPLTGFGAPWPVSSWVRSNLGASAQTGSCVPATLTSDCWQLTCEVRGPFGTSWYSFHVQNGSVTSATRTR